MGFSERARGVFWVQHNSWSQNEGGDLKHERVVSWKAETTPCKKKIKYALQTISAFQHYAFYTWV